MNVEVMVAGGRIELPTRGFSERRCQFDPLFFNNLPGRPLPILPDNAGLFITDSRKIHAKTFSFFQRSGTQNRRVPYQ